ncbi:hypothetical protein Tco_1015383 [Tanacetum coccineum]|uniref:Uncharacterized protein n=1 Tax=Tanacetum coccineum TaxID=301880 RepID=A0ABQ5FLZ8_9ASTR
MAGLDEGLKMLKNRVVSEPPTFKPEFLLQASYNVINLKTNHVKSKEEGESWQIIKGTISFVADFFLALIEWPVIGMTKESSAASGPRSLNFIASTLNRAERLTVSDTHFEMA